MEADRDDELDDGYCIGSGGLHMHDGSQHHHHHHHQEGDLVQDLTVEGARSKKRERDRKARDEAGVKEEDEAEQSPSKRPHKRGDDDAPLTGKELRDLFAQHLHSVEHEMQLVLGDARGRIDGIEQNQATTKGDIDIATIGGRLAIAEKDNVLQQTELARHIRNKSVVWRMLWRTSSINWQRSRFKVYPVMLLVLTNDPLYMGDMREDLIHGRST